MEPNHKIVASIPVYHLQWELEKVWLLSDRTAAWWGLCPHFSHFYQYKIPFKIDGDKEKKETWQENATVGRS